TFWIPADRRERFTGLFMSALVLSGLIGGPISGAIMAGMEGVAGARAWQWLFIIEALPSIVLGILVLVYLTDTPDQAKWLSEREKAIVRADLAREAHPDGAGPKISHTL